MEEPLFASCRADLLIRSRYRRDRFEITGWPLTKYIC
jgi:hypothetical protein